MTSSGRFTITRASDTDLPELLRLQYKCFPPFIREVFMGCTSEDSLPRFIEFWANNLSKDPHDVWIKVVDSTTGKIAAGSNWKVYPNSAPPEWSDDVPMPWLEGEVKEKAIRIFNACNDARRKANPGGFIHLHICYTDPEYQRQGLGGMMLRWGCDLADQLFLPGWIEASSEGNFLYKKFGFYDFSEVGSGLMDGTVMKRNVRLGT